MAHRHQLHVPVTYLYSLPTVLHQRTPLHHMTLVASGTYTCGAHRTVTNGKRTLKWLPFLGHTKKQQTWDLGLYVKEDY